MYPELLKTPWFTLQSYGFCLAMAYLVAIELGIRKAEREGLDPKKISNFVLVLVISAFAGGRALYVYTEWPVFREDPIQILKIWQGGLVFYGGLLGGFFACLTYVKVSGLKPLQLADMAMPSVAIGQSIGRVGCLLVGCCFGAPWDGPWAIHLHGQTRHPVQFYATISLFVLWLLLEKLYAAKARQKPGIVLLGYMYYQCFHRYTMETFRVDPRGGTFHFGMSISQEIAVGIGLAALTVHLCLAKFVWAKMPPEVPKGKGEPASSFEDDDEVPTEVSPRAQKKARNRKKKR